MFIYLGENSREMMIESEDFSFHDLVQAIQLAHEQLAGQAAKAVNVSLTMRNWIIGFYIREYEQKGADRAEYGITCSIL